MSVAKPLSPDLLADRWQCSAETVRQMIHRGELRGFRVGRMIRIPWDAVEEIERCQTSPLAVCEGAFAYTGMIPEQDAASAISLRHAQERRRNPKAVSDTSEKRGPLGR